MFCPFSVNEFYWGLTPPNGLKNGIKEVKTKVNGTSTNSSQVLVQSLSLCYVSYRVIRSKVIRS